MRGLLLAGAALGLALPAGADEKVEPEEKPVKVKLVAKKTTYKLDRGGLTAEKYRESIREAAKTGKPLPKPPAVEMSLEVKNTTGKDIQVWVGGDPVQVTLNLKGKGAVSVPSGLAFTAIFIAPRAMTLKPGKTHTILINSLSYGSRGASNYAYWTEPGTYTLSASFQTATSPAPKGAKADESGFGRVTLTTEPIKIKVTEK